MNAAKLSDRFYVICLFLLIAAGSYSAFREFLPFLHSGATEDEQKRALAISEPRPALSYFGNRIYLDDCIKTLSNVVNRIENTPALAVAAGNCRAFAQNQTLVSPANAYAYAVIAYAEFVLDDHKSANAFLEKSRSIAPSEAWLASLRLRQHREFNQNASQVSYSLGQDVKTLGMTGIGRNWLAEWYKTDETSRRLIVQAIETLSDSEQSAFLRSVQR
jgi:hypothetical protein